jgi:hypothetical protein
VSERAALLVPGAAGRRKSFRLGLIALDIAADFERLPKESISPAMIEKAELKF